MKKYKKMVTTFNKKDMVSFGNYLLSDQRKKLINRNPELLKKNVLEQSSCEDCSKTPKEGYSLDDYLSKAHNFDLEQWLRFQNEFKNVSAVGQMCLETLDPEEFEAWEKVRAGLMNSRRSLSGKS